MCLNYTEWIVFCRMRSYYSFVTAIEASNSMTVDGKSRPPSLGGKDHRSRSRVARRSTACDGWD